MELTLFLAKLMGIFSLIYGVSLLLEKKMIIGIFSSFLGEERLTSYILGLLEVLGGLAIILTHNIWNEGMLALVVTILGWLLLLDGVNYLFMSKKRLSNMLGMLQYSKMYYFGATVLIVLGLYLTYFGFQG